MTRDARKPFVFKEGLIWFVDWYGTLAQFDTWRDAFTHALRIAR